MKSKFFKTFIKISETLFDADGQGLEDAEDIDDANYPTWTLLVSRFMADYMIQVLRIIGLLIHLRASLLRLSSPEVFRIRFRLPSKGKIADGLMIFLCTPDEAEVVVGDLLEKYEQVASRHHKWLANFWFASELIILILSKGKSRLVKTIVPKRVADYFSKPAE